MDSALKWILGIIALYMLLIVVAEVFSGGSSPKITVSEAAMQACLNAGRTPDIEVDTVARTAQFRCEEKSP